MQKLQFKTGGENEVLYLWDKLPAGTQPRLVVQLLHGMAEHILRYDHFANYLNSRGIIFAGLDLRGHGTTAALPGYDAGDMWKNNLADNVALAAHLKSQYKLPLVILGHSYGSMLTQRLMQLGTVADAFVLSGSGYMAGALYAIGRKVAWITCRRKGEKAPGKLMEKLSFGPYDKLFPGGFNWLSRDGAQVAKYKADPLCGYTCSANFYRGFLRGVKGLYTKQAAAALDKTKPVLIMSGDKDPVGGCGKGLAKLRAFYQKSGVQNLEMKLFEGGRHEMLNETNSAEVYDFLAGALEKLVQAK